MSIRVLEIAAQLRQQTKGRECLDVKAAAELLGVTRETVRLAIRDGQLQATRRVERGPWSITTYDVALYLAGPVG